MTRILSALILLLIVVGTIWFLPAGASLVLAEIAAVCAFVEYRRLTDRIGARVPGAVTGIGVVATCATMGWPDATIDGTLLAAMIAIGATVVGARPTGDQTLRDASAAMFAIVYIGLPLGALAAIRFEAGPQALLVLMGTVMISDITQYYGGRLLGRRRLAPSISPSKTVEGALAGFAAGAVGMVTIGRWWLPAVSPGVLALLGATIVALGIVGDLFESSLKRSAGLKDASGLIPGHGGVLDRIDSLLFAGPVFYIVLRYLHP